MCVHPFVDRLLPIVTDSFVDMAFGTGAVKITPAHDHNDYEVSAQKHLSHHVFLRVAYFCRLASVTTCPSSRASTTTGTSRPAAASSVAWRDSRRGEQWPRHSRRRASTGTRRTILWLYLFAGRILFSHNDRVMTHFSTIFISIYFFYMLSLCLLYKIIFLYLSNLFSRSKDVIEPILKAQWYVNCNEMATKALKAVQDGELKIVPEAHVATWNRWLESIR